MDRGNVHDRTQPGGTPGHQNAAGSASDSGPVHPAEEEREQRGRIASTVKGAFKIYLVPAMRAQTALASAKGCWRNLVTEARQEHEARKRAADPKEPDAEPAVTAGASTALVTDPGEPQHSTPRRPTTSARASKPRAPGASRGHVAAPSEGVESAAPTSPSLPGPVETEAAEAPTPMLVESGESSVEVRPNPAISPPHVTSGVIAHIGPEVRHKLAGDGPIRA